MAKQKLVLKVAAMEDAKRRSKALKTAVGLSGVISASLDKDCLIVVGDGVDSVELATVLRRKMGSANLLHNRNGSLLHSLIPCSSLALSPPFHQSEAVAFYPNARNDTAIALGSSSSVQYLRMNGTESKGS
ncbi:hypothetical protein ZIOFF_048126 [Zingiber officinale]|uniref:Uncharacterized protein n=1 Tax=Zingiber officinale TaxID=94328 RepID=A0A8J5FSS8_ZINOF|nr:hypothetical protein ZIOFF_048126 [Zingiber officinale]